MPLVTIDMHDHLASRRAEIGDAIHGGLVEGWEFPPDDLFQIFHIHKEGDLIYSRTYPDADRSDILFVHILVFNGYSAEVKQAGARLVVDRLAALGIKRDNVLISLTENGEGDWLAPQKEDTDGTR